MTDDDIRLLIRGAIARHLDARPEPPQTTAVSSTPAPLSFSRYALPRAADDVMCIIEPAVKCNHCGYCLCHGH